MKRRRDSDFKVGVVHNYCPQADGKQKRNDSKEGLDLFQPLRVAPVWSADFGIKQLVTV